MTTQRWRVLLVLCGLLLFALYYAWEQSSSQPSPAGAAQHHNSSHSNRVKADNDQGVVPLQSYRSAQGAFKTPQKNLFGSAYPPLPAAPVRQPTEVNKVTATQKKSLPVAAPPPPPPFAVIGHLVRGGEPTVFLAAADGEVHLVQAGTRFAGNAVVQYVDRHEIVIATADEAEPLVLPIEKAENMRFPSQRMASDRVAFIAAVTDQEDDEEDVEEEVKEGDEEEEVQEGDEEEEVEEEDNEETQGL